MADASSSVTSAAVEKDRTRTVDIKLSVLYQLYIAEGQMPSAHDSPVLRRWAKAVATEAGVELRITHSFMTRVWRRISKLLSEVKRVRGGRQRADFLERTWSLALQPGDFRSENDLVLQENTRTLQEANRKLLNENSVLTKENKKVTQSENKLKAQVVKLSEHVRKAKAAGHAVTRGRSRVKSPSKCTPRQQRKLKKKRANSCSDSLAWLEEEGYTPTKVIIHNTTTGQEETVDLDTGDLGGDESSSASEEDVHVINMALYIKDKQNLSGRAYHELAQLFKEMPRFYKLKKRIQVLNEQWNIKPTPEGTIGVQQSLEDRLRFCLDSLISNSPPDAKFLTEGKVRVKLTGDGTNIGKRLHVVNFAFTVLEEGDKAYSSAGNHCLAIFKEPESYESLELCLRDLRQEVEKLTSIVVNGHTFEVEYHLGGDWKFLAMVTGIDSAASNYACIWCKCPAGERHDTIKQWSISDTRKGARTIDENLELSQKRSGNRFNVSRRPLFPTIPLTRVVVDNLHMFLRVTDVLIDLLIGELRRLDKVEKATSRLSSLTTLTHIKSFEQAVKSLGIPGYSFWIGRESRKLKWRTLTGPEKLTLFEKLDIPGLFPHVENVTEVQQLWKDFLSVHKCFSARPETITADDITTFEAKAKAFIRDFTYVYPAKHVTPYMHCMMMHVGDFMRLHGAIVPFTQQGLEKYNDQMTKNYFRSSNHRGEQCLVQILNKHNRLEFLEGIGMQRPKKHAVTCGNCNSVGHTRWTCNEACTYCGHTPFKAHLIDSGTTKIASCQH